MIVDIGSLTKVSLADVQRYPHIVHNLRINVIAILSWVETKLPSINFEQFADAAVKDDFSAGSVFRLLS